MKKAKILVPAIAAMILSVAAAGTGTYAWFTATRTASVTTAGTGAIATEGALSAALTIGKGTTLAGGSGDAKDTTVKHGNLTDGSVELSETDGTAKVYGAKFDATGTAVSGFEETTSWKAFEGTVGADKHNVWRATSFDVTFTLDVTYAELNAKYGLFFNGSAETTCTTNSAIKKALRVGMVTEHSSPAEHEVCVFAPFADDGNLGYVTSNDASATAGTGKYKSTPGGERYAKAKVTTYDQDTIAGANGANFLGNFTKAEAGDKTKTVKVTVVTWFEGEDPACKVVEGLAEDAVNYTLAFNVVQYKAHA